MEKPPLDIVQRWMQSVIAHPGGVEAGMAAEATKQHLDVDTEKIEQVVGRSQSQTSIERLAVYANAYYSRLIECLESEFPIFRQTVGEDTFAQFAVDYLQRYPSQSYTLGKLGENFPRYLDETKPPRQPKEPQIGWADFLVDLARLERTFSEVFDGPGVEDQPRLTTNELLAIAPYKWARVRLKIVPCLRLLSPRFPLNDFYTAAKSGAEPALPAAADSWMAITRRDYIVRRYELNRSQFLLLNALQRGETIGDAIACAAESYLGEAEQFAVELQTWFKIWTAAPMFESVVIER